MIPTERRAYRHGTAPVALADVDAHRAIGARRVGDLLSIRRDRRVQLEPVVVRDVLRCGNAQRAHEAIAGPLAIATHCDGEHEPRTHDAADEKPARGQS